MEKRIVVTGVAGFVGSNLAKHLIDRGYSVLGIDNLSAGTLENVDSRVDFHKIDIRDFGSLSAAARHGCRLSSGGQKFLNGLSGPSSRGCQRQHPRNLNLLEAAREGKVGQVHLCRHRG